MRVAADSQVARLADDPQLDMLAGQARAFRLDAGEEQGEVFVALTVHTRSEAVARKLATLIEGAAAAASLFANTHEEVQEVLPFLEGVRARVEGEVIHAIIRFPVHELRRWFDDGSPPSTGRRGRRRAV